MTVNPRIRCDQVVINDGYASHVWPAKVPIPTGAEIIQVGPDRASLIAQLAALGQAAAYLIRTQAHG